ncbi:MAG: hypothetical protein ABI895_06095 [Deltaproteobacteria bacterium]
MKSTAWLGAVAMTLVAFSCNPGLSLEDALKNKRCSGPAFTCLDGYTCVEDVCVSNAGLPEAGSAGSGSSGGAGGSETIGDGMDTISSDVPDAADASPGCTPLLLFRDQDRDGFGSALVEAPQTMCPTEGWVNRGGDCLDEPTADNHAAEVHPEQGDFFTDGYPRPGQPGEISFDYDCSGGEEADPGNTTDRRVGDCASASATNCGLATGVQTNVRPGAGVDDRCGGAMVLCNNLSLEQCIPEEQTNVIYRCH